MRDASRRIYGVIKPYPSQPGVSTDEQYSSAASGALVRRTAPGALTQHREVSTREGVSTFRLVSGQSYSTSQQPAATESRAVSCDDVVHQVLLGDFKVITEAMADASQQVSCHHTSHVMHVIHPSRTIRYYSIHQVFEIRV